MADASGAVTHHPPGRTAVPPPAPRSGEAAPAWRTRARRLVPSTPRGAALAAALLGAVVYVHAVANGFAYDDLPIVVGNADLHRLDTLWGLMGRPYWPGEYGGQNGIWRPGMVALLGLQWAAWGDAPAPFHAVNVVVHAGASAVVTLLVARLAPLRVALLGGLLFAVHAVHVEAVANVVGLADVLSTVFVVAACLLHLGAPRAAYGAARLAGVALLYLAAFSVKESAATLPALLLVLDAVRDGLRFRDVPGYLRRRGLVYAALAGVAATMLVGRWSVLGAVADPLPPLGAHLLGEGVPRVWTLAQVWLHYARLLVAPVELAADYAPDVIPVALGWTAQAVAGAALALAALAGALLAWRGAPPTPETASPRLLTLAVAWFGVAILPVSNVLFLSGVFLAERTLYLPSVAVALAGGWALDALVRHRREGGAVLAGAALALMAARTVTRVPVWDDTNRVFDDLLARHPDAGAGWLYLGDRFAREGRPGAAVRATANALTIAGAEYVPVTKLATRLDAVPRAAPGSARRLLERAWRERPDLQTAPGLLAIHHLGRREPGPGLPPARAAAALAPTNPAPLYVLASLLTLDGRPDEAIPRRLRSIALGGDGWRARLDLARDYAAVGDRAAAREALAAAGALASTDGARDEVRRAESELLGATPAQDDASTIHDQESR